MRLSMVTRGPETFPGAVSPGKAQSLSLEKQGVILLHTPHALMVKIERSKCN